MLSAIKRTVPQFVKDYVRKIRGHERHWQWFRGSYPSWEEAMQASQGYDHTSILDGMVAATEEVEHGRASWERDGATFPDAEIHIPLIDSLVKIAEENGGRLDVIDFGGALGSTWRQHRALFETLRGVSWRVVEQGHYVQAGRPFQNRTLSFHVTIDEALKQGPASTLLLSSVLPYIEHPYQLLNDTLGRRFEHVIIDRTPFAKSGREKLTVQHTPLDLGGGTYPCWIFDAQKVIQCFTRDYELAAEWPGFDQLDQQRVDYRGYHFALKRP